MPPTYEVIVRDRQTGAFHKAQRIPGVPGLYIADSCAVMEYDEVPWTVVELAEPDGLHYRCFPPGHRVPS
jgi:hypothetical protein